MHSRGNVVGTSLAGSGSDNHVSLNFVALHLCMLYTCSFSVLFPFILQSTFTCLVAIMSKIHTIILHAPDVWNQYDVKCMSPGSMFRILTGILHVPYLWHGVNYRHSFTTISGLTHALAAIANNATD